MATNNEEIEEVKSLTKHQLASIVWPMRTPRDNASYADQLALHIRTRFNEPAEKFGRELHEFANLRNIAVSTLVENSLRDNSSLNALKRYYCQLASMLARFRESDAKFSWKDSFGRGSAEGNLEFELNNIMYDIAAIHNELGSKIPRTNESTTRDACLHYSSALWWVTELRDNRTGLKPKELGHDLLTFFHHVLRAQAQECVLSHSIKSGMRLDNVAKIAAQIVSDYDVAAKLASTPLYSDPLKEILSGASIFQNWRSTVEFKHKYHLALSQLFLGLSCKDDDAKEIGSRITRLKLANQSLESCKTLIPATFDASTTRAAFETIDTMVKKKLDKAVRYNDNVYHSSIPSPDTLPQIDGKLVVSPAAFSISSFQDFKDLFSNLVTIEAVQVSSIYSQRKDELSREVSTKVSKQDEELAQMMSTLNIDKRNLKLPSIGAPDDLIEICAELSMSPSIVDDVLTKLEEIDDKSEEIQKMLEATEDMLKRQPHPGNQNDLKLYKSFQEKALMTKQSLHKQLYPELQQKIQLMATTSNPAELLPPLEAASQTDDEVIRKLSKLIDKVDEMKQQRASLVTQLRQSLDKDDVIKHVVAATSEDELRKVFDQEIKKHDKYWKPLQSNLSLQNEMLDTLEQVNAQYGRVKLDHRARERALGDQVSSLREFYNQFTATSNGIDDCLNNHNRILELVRKLYTKVQSVNLI